MIRVRKFKSLKVVALLIAFILMVSVFTVGCSQTAPVQEQAQPKQESTEQTTQAKQEDTQAKEEQKDNKLNLYRDARGMNGVVSAGKPEASKVGVEIFKKGGNAVDAAVATAFAIGVLEPNASGLGGGGFMIVRFAETGEEVVIDFREMAPANSTPDMFKEYFDENGKPKNGYAFAFNAKATGVPGEVAGLITALEKYGTMSLEEVLEPAIKLAEEGIPVTGNLAGIIADAYEVLNANEGSKKLWLNEDGFPYNEGEVIKNPELANTLRAIAKGGKDAFYKGEIAEKIVNEVQKNGGVMTLEDLANYEVKMRKPVTGTYRGYEIVSSPPASSGGTHVVEILNILENFDMKSLGHNTVDGLHAWSEAMKMVYADRGKYMADTDFVDGVPLQGLVSKDYAKTLYDKIDMDKAAQDVEAGDPLPYESSSTTHFSVMDKEGNMVSCTKSINFFFGCGITVPETGIVMNNHMVDFNLVPGTKNSIEPGKRPLSSMSPTLVLKDGEPVMVLGSPGGKKIIAAVAQVISNVIDHDMDMQEAIIAPRMFIQPNKPLELEGRIPQDVIDGLKEKGHEISIKEEFYPSLGSVNTVIKEANGELHGGADPRRDSQAVGY